MEQRPEPFVNNPSLDLSENLGLLPFLSLLIICLTGYAMSLTIPSPAPRPLVTIYGRKRKKNA